MKINFWLCVCGWVAMTIPASAVSLWNEDFEGAALGATSGNNQALAGTVIETANTASCIVVNSSTDAAVASVFTLASGNFIRVSTGTSLYTAIRSTLNPIPFAQVAPTNTYTLSFDLYIPADLVVAVGGIQPRFSLEGTGESTTDDRYAVKSAGQRHIVYTGLISDFIDTDVNEARPFIGIDQAGAALEDFLYLDNIQFQVGEVDSNVSPIDPVYFANLRAARTESNPLVQWQHFGPGMSGYIDMFWINNGDPDAMYDSLDMGNSQVTLNGGAFWRSLRDSDGCGYHPDYFTAIDFSFSDPDFGLAVRRNVKDKVAEVYQSTDRGASWTFLSQPIAGENKKHNVIAVDPLDDDNWYIGAGGGGFIKDIHYTVNGIVNTSDYTAFGSEGFILYSKDRGVTWTKVSDPFESDSSFSAIVVDPRNGDRVYAACQHGVYQSTDAGGSWAKVAGGGLPHNQPRYMTSFYDAKANNGAGEFLLYIVEITHYTATGAMTDATGGVYRSADGGENWENLTGDLALDLTQISTSAYHDKYYRAIAFWLELAGADPSTSELVQAAKAAYPELPTRTLSQYHMIGVDPENKDRVYLIHNFKHDYAFPPGNIWMTENGGTNWYAAAREGTYWSERTDQSYWESRTVQPLGTNVTFAHVDREHREAIDTNTGPRFLRVNQLGHIYTAFAQQIICSTDHGESWTQVDDDETAPGSGQWVGRGNCNLPGNLFCLETGTPGSYLWGSGEHGLWRNTQGDSVYPGAIAMQQLTGQSIKDYDTTSPCSIAVDPSDTNKIYTLQFRQSNRGTLRYSSDAGKTWETKSTPLPTTMDLHEASLMVDHANPDTLYFTVPLSMWTPYGGNGAFRPNNSAFTTNGIYKSVDGGESFELINNGIRANASVLKLCFDPTDSLTLYAASNQSHTDVDGGLYKSVDGGANWSELSVPMGVNSVNDVMIDAASGDLYIGCGNHEGDGSVGGAYVSHDEGASWVLIFDLPYVRGIDVCAANADVMTVIAGNDDEIDEVNPGAYVTIDGAVTWHKINRHFGQPEKVSELRCDPYDDSVLWCCLSGTGFWRADISPLRTGVKKPFFWDWMAEQGLSDRTGDSDGDGSDNQLEYIADTNPNDSAAYFSAEISANSGGGMGINFRSAASRLYTVEMTDSLLTPWSIFTNRVVGTGGFITLPDWSGASNRFYRIRAELE